MVQIFSMWMDGSDANLQSADLQTSLFRPHTILVGHALWWVDDPIGRHQLAPRMFSSNARLLFLLSTENIPSHVKNWGGQPTSCSTGYEPNFYALDSLVLGLLELTKRLMSLTLLTGKIMSREIWQVGNFSRVLGCVR